MTTRFVPYVTPGEHDRPSAQCGACKRWYYLDGSPPEPYGPCCRPSAQILVRPRKETT